MQLRKPLQLQIITRKKTPTTASNGRLVCMYSDQGYKKNFYNRRVYNSEWSSSDKDESGPRTFVNVETPIPANPVVASLKVTAGFEASPLSADY